MKKGSRIPPLTFTLKPRQKRKEPEADPEDLSYIASTWTPFVAYSALGRIWGFNFPEKFVALRQTLKIKDIDHFMEFALGTLFNRQADVCYIEELDLYDFPVPQKTQKSFEDSINNAMPLFKHGLLTMCEDSAQIQPKSFCSAIEVIDA